MATVRQCHLESGRLVDDVTIGQDESIGCENEARAAAVHPRREARRRYLFVAELLVDFDINDRRTDLFRRADNCLRIGVEQVSLRRSLSTLRGLRALGLDVAV